MNINRVFVTSKGDEIYFNGLLIPNGNGYNKSVDGYSTLFKEK